MLGGRSKARLAQGSSALGSARLAAPAPHLCCPGTHVEPVLQPNTAKFWIFPAVSVGCGFALLAQRALTASPTCQEPGAAAGAASLPVLGCWARAHCQAADIHRDVCSPATAAPRHGGRKRHFSSHIRSRGSSTRNPRWHQILHFVFE